MFVLKKKRKEKEKKRKEKQMGDVTVDLALSISPPGRCTTQFKLGPQGLTAYNVPSEGHKGYASSRQDEYMLKK